MCNQQQVGGKTLQSSRSPVASKGRHYRIRPFTITGMDFTGALYIKARGGETKVHICISTCAVTHAVHIEVVSDLTVPTIMLAFRRFSNQKSLPSIMISDNVSTFLVVAEDLQRLFKSEILQRELEHHNVTWHFIPKQAPWYGGFWEQMVGLTS